MPAPLTAQRSAVRCSEWRRRRPSAAAKTSRRAGEAARPLAAASSDGEAARPHAAASSDGEAARPHAAASCDGEAARPLAAASSDCCPLPDA
eukprot:5985476-Prymnesium_polylepis.1